MSDIDLLELSRRGPVHFVGVSGAGVSALAELVLHNGGAVTGCDLKPGEVGDTLRARGASIHDGHDPSHVQDAVAVVTTAAVPADHPELVAARERGIPVLKRAAALGAIVNSGTVVGIAGTHGKTTTTAMTTLVLEAGGLDPTGFVGGRVAAWGGNLRPGSSDIYVVEADEYDRSFHQLRADAAVVTTLEADHLDIFGSLEEVERAFEKFLEPIPETGLIAVCGDDAGAAALGDRVNHPGVRRYGTGATCQLRATDVAVSGSSMRFEVGEGDRSLGHVTLQVPGLHNLRNSLAAIAVGLHFNVPFDDIRRALAGYRAVARRFQVLGEAGGVVVVDDYAHHPTEVRATLQAARDAYTRRRLVAVFQPHLYTRTRDFHREFGQALGAADVVWVSDVYPAREKPIEGVTGELVANAAREAGADVRYHASLDELRDALRHDVASGDLLLTMGAGDVNRIGAELFRELSAADGAPTGAAGNGGGAA